MNKAKQGGEMIDGGYIIPFDVAMQWNEKMPVAKRLKEFIFVAPGWVSVSAKDFAPLFAQVLEALNAPNHPDN